MANESHMPDCAALRCKYVTCGLTPEEHLVTEQRQHGSMVHVFEPTGPCNCELGRLRGEIERAYQMLEIYGVTRERAKSLANGIEVLSARRRKEVREIRARVQELEKGQHLTDKLLQREKSQ